MHLHPPTTLYQRSISLVSLLLAAVLYIPQPTRKSTSTEASSDMTTSRLE